MSILTFEFFLLLFCGCVSYYLVPSKIQKYVLLAVSICFFFLSSEQELIWVWLEIILIVYVGALFLERAKGKVRTLILLILAGGIIANLIYFKYLYNLVELLSALLRFDGNFSVLKLVAPIGISYYSLSAIGYLMDVYWEAYKAERNFTKISLFVSYFPVIVSGPVLRYGEMKKEFSERHSLEYENIKYGLLRMVYGYFKKLLIADQLSMMVASIYGVSGESTSGAIYLVGVIAYAFQLYADFSGCMDIIMGASLLFGVRLPENFEAPFFSRNVPEFWRRWHISLGKWFKDYVMYPMLKTNIIQKMTRNLKEKLGKKYGKMIPTFLVLFIMWMLIGLWHGGTGYYFMASAIIPCIFLMASEMSATTFDKLKKKLGIQQTSIALSIFQSMRTLAILCICWVFVCTGSVSGGLDVLKRIVLDFDIRALMLRPINTYGIDMIHALILFVGLCVVLVIDWFCYKQVMPQVWLKRIPKPVQYISIWIMVLSIMFFADFGQSVFIYFQF